MATYYLSGELDQEKTKEIQLFLEALGRKKGVLYINSEGGDDTQGLAIYDLIRYHQPNLTAVVVGACQSAAILVLLACRTRKAMPNAQIMIHHGTISEIDGMHQREFINYAKQVLRIDKAYEQLIVTNTKLSRSKYKSLAKFGHYFGADEAVKLGFVDSVLINNKG